MAGLGRLLYTVRTERTRLPACSACTTLWLTQSADGLAHVVASILLLAILSMPFAWRNIFQGSRRVKNTTGSDLRFACRHVPSGSHNQGLTGSSTGFGR